MTSHATSAVHGAIARPGSTTARRVRAPGRIAAAAIAAAIGGALLGGGATLAVLGPLDAAAEQQRLVEYGEQLQRAIRWDDLQRDLNRHRP